MAGDHPLAVKAPKHVAPMGSGNNGPDIAGLFQDVNIDPAAEMRAFEQFGPQARRVLDELMCIRWSSVRTLELMRTWNIDVQSPFWDRRVADWLTGINEEVLRRLGRESS